MCWNQHCSRNHCVSRPVHIAERGVCTKQSPACWPASGPSMRNYRGQPLGDKESLLQSGCKEQPGCAASLGSGVRLAPPIGSAYVARHPYRHRRPTPRHALAGSAPRPSAAPHAPSPGLCLRTTGARLPPGAGGLPRGGPPPGRPWACVPPGGVAGAGAGAGAAGAGRGRGGRGREL